MKISHVYRFPLLLLAAGLLSTAGCKKDDDDTSTEPENITTVVLTVTGPNNFNESYEWNDLDGAGGDLPQVENMILSANEQYNVSVRFEDRSRTPVQDLTAEILAEDEKHLLTFTPAGPNVTINYADSDGNNKPVGLSTTWTTGTLSLGKVTIRLFHEPTNKNDTTNPGGETDVQVDFPLRVL
jgi:hypothetical protein